MIKAGINGKKLVVEVDLEKVPKPSKSGKTMVVATSGGFMPTTAQINEQAVMVSLNAIIEKPSETDDTSAKQADKAEGKAKTA